MPANRDSLMLLEGLWGVAQLDQRRACTLELTGAEPVLPSSFAVGTAAQVSLGAAALAAGELGVKRGAAPQTVAVDMREAAMECMGWFSVDGRVPDKWDKISGLYRCRDGWVRIHANFAHHRDGALRLLGLPEGAETQKAEVARALANWTAEAFESAAAAKGLVVAAARSFEQWDDMPQARAVARLPVITLERIGDAPPLALPPLASAAPPLDGVRVLDLTRILAGPVGGRTLAAYGADVMLVNSPKLPNIESIVDTSRGKRSSLLDLRDEAGREGLRELVAGAHVFSQGYRPGGLEELGFGPEVLARLRPGIVCVSLSAYSHAGPWATRRGFDSLVQTATGFNMAEALALGSADPKPLPMQILDYATGFLMAFGAAAGLLRQQREGGSWLVRVSLAQTACWLRAMGRVEDGFAAPAADFSGLTETTRTDWGELVALRHAARFSRTPAVWKLPSMPPGSHAPRWLG